jgi:hypothetical protein
MTETPPPVASTSSKASPQRGRRRVLPKVLIGVAILLVAAIATGVVYAVNIDRSVTRNITRGIDLPSDSPSTTCCWARTAGIPTTQATGAATRSCSCT